MKSPKKSYRIIKTSRPLVLSLSCTKPSTFNKSSEPEFKTTDSSITKNKKRKVSQEQDDQEISTNQVLNDKPSTTLVAPSSTRPNLNSVILKCHVCEQEFYGFLYLELHLKHWHEGENIEVTAVQNRKNIETNPSKKIVTSTNTKIESLDTMAMDFENQCPYCIKKFVTYQDLEIHLRSHNVNQQNTGQEISSSLLSKLKSENLSPSILEEPSTIIKVNQMMISPSKPTKMSSTQFAFFQKKSRTVS